MREWYALAAIERAREQYPDLTREEEDRIFDFDMADDGRCLFLRCTFSGEYFPYRGALTQNQIRDLDQYIQLTW